MVTSDFGPEVEILPFHASAMKNLQYNPYYRNSLSFWTWLWGGYHIPQNVFLVVINMLL